MYCNGILSSKLGVLAILLCHKIRWALKSLLLCFAFLVGCLPVAHSQEFFADCREDISNFCSDVSPDNGRIVSCLYAHQDKIAPACGASMVDVNNSLDFIFNSLEDMFRSCGDNITEFCSGKKFGYGRIYSCLAEKQSSLSGSCRRLVTEFQLGFSAR